MVSLPTPRFTFHSRFILTFSFFSCNFTLDYLSMCSSLHLFILDQWASSPHRCVAPRRPPLSVAIVALRKRTPWSLSSRVPVRKCGPQLIRITNVMGSESSLPLFKSSKCCQIEPRSCRGFIVSVNPLLLCFSLNHLVISSFPSVFHPLFRCRRIRCEPALGRPAHERIQTAPSVLIQCERAPAMGTHRTAAVDSGRLAGKRTFEFNFLFLKMRLFRFLPVNAPSLRHFKPFQSSQPVTLDAFSLY